MSSSSSSDLPITTRPLVSVVVPAFRHAAYIDRCLDSIVDQTYPRLELVLVDDNSPDETYARATSFLKGGKTRIRFERVVLRRNSVNRGAPHTLNRAMALTSGDYVTFINSDDLYGTSRITSLVDAMERADAELAFTGVLPIDEDDNACFVEPIAHQIFWRPAIAKQRWPSLSWGFLAHQLTASTGNIIVSRRLMSRVGFFRALRYCHDWDFILRCCYFSEPILVADALYQYRLHRDNSFRSLADVADHDSAFVRSSFLEKVMTSPPPNRLAPAPQNWPTLFDELAEMAGAGALMQSLYSPYRPHFRTVDAAIRGGA
jgi:glycosyltransferase involved in cell wall biosynthesis